VAHRHRNRGSPPNGTAALTGRNIHHLEVLDGTPVIDVKAVLDEIADR